MIKKTVLSALALFLTFFTVSCEAEMPSIPTYTSFTLKATVSGEREFQATITEDYAEFTSEFLSFPVRFQNGTVSCEGISVNVKTKEGSIFRLSEIIAKALSGNGENGKIALKSDIYEIETTVNGKQITVWIDKQTKTPTAFFTDEYTVNVIDFQNTTDESHTQNMGDG